jgi:hypothetical protein
MNKRKLQVVCGLMCSLTILLSGCTKESSQTGIEHDEIKKENTTLAKENSKLEGKYEELEEQVEVLKQELGNLTSALESKEADSTKADENSETMSFPVYVKEPNSKEVVSETSITMRSDLTLQQKIESLVSSLAELKFKEFTIEVEPIEDKHAVIKLKEKDENNYENSGIKRYFGDGTQAELNNTCLSETLLQKQYQGEWIESIRIIYDGPEEWRTNNNYIQDLEGTYDR